MHLWLGLGISEMHWRSPSRGRCVQRQRLSHPDVQVNRGQVFQIEWTTGHPGSTSYFVLLAAEHEPKMGAPRI